MRTVRDTAPARVALAGNPSDGYGGRTISLAIENYRATVTVSESAELEIVPAPQDEVRFASVAALVDDVRANGYYGGLRLLKAAIRCFAEHCRERGAAIDDRTFSIRYETGIPRGVGLGGSSAIVTAAIRAMAAFHGVEIERERLPDLVLSVETRELGIVAGLQDRVAQAYGGLTYMDFDPALVARDGHGAYEPLDPSLLPPLFVAHQSRAAEPSEVFHSDLRRRFDAGERDVVRAMSRLAEQADAARGAVLDGDADALGRAMDASFDARRSIAALDPRHVRMVELARSLGAAANFAGSGGAIVGLLGNGADLERLERAFRAEGCPIAVCRPAAPVG
jgi:glucuronokinase